LNNLYVLYEKIVNSLSLYTSGSQPVGRDPKVGRGVVFVGSVNQRGLRVPRNLRGKCGNPYFYACWAGAGCEILCACN